MDGKPVAETVRHERRGSVLLLAMAQRPVNALTADLRTALRAGLHLAATDESLRAVVICSDIAQFSAGADLSETGRPVAANTGAVPDLAALCDQIESFAKPVIVALNGNALGGGLELALAAHGRVAQASAHLGLPDVSLGVLPVAGATQRLPRLVGAGPALKLLLEPQPISAVQALTIGLVDEVVETDLRDKACAAAEAMAAALQGQPPQRTSDRREGMRDGKAFQAAIAAARTKLAGSHLPAPHRAVDCVEAAQLLPLDQGLAYERAACAELVGTPEARGLRHAFFAERRAAFPPASVAAQGNPQLTTLAIWGGGDAAVELVAQSLTAGLRVILVDPKREVLVKTLEKVATRQETAVAEGRLTAAARDADWARLTSTMAATGLAGADLVLAFPDAGPVPLDPPAAILPLGALPQRAGPGRAALIPAVAAGLVAELASTTDAPPALLALGLALGRRLGWKLLFTGAGGPIDRRLRAALSATIAQLEAEGINRQTIAAALASFGLGVGARATLPAAPPQAKVVLDACLSAMANQGARLISEGVARRPSDIDAVAVLTGLFPRWQGGPMFHADARGLLVVRADLRRRAEAAPQIFAPDPLFDHLIADGRDFAALNRAD